MPKTVLYGLVAVLAIMAIGIFYYVVYGGRVNQDLQQILSDNGFTELRPPSTLIQPGTWVQVQRRNPLHLSTVCSAQSALSLSPEQLMMSLSADTSVTRKFNGNFNIDLSSLDISESQMKSKVATSAKLSLKNVRLLELSDDQIVKNIGKRDAACTEAIKIRLAANRDSLTMIDSVLIADAEYTFTFAADAEANEKAEFLNEVGARFNLSASAGRNDSSLLIGKNLIWGVTDDEVMARLGAELPSTGSKGNEARGILKGSGPVESIDSDQEVRRSFDGLPVQIKQDVSVLTQPTEMSCWATVFAMMMSWKTGKAVTIENAVATLGEPYIKYFEDDTGLPGGSEKSFVAAAGLTAMPPANYPLKTFRRVLREKGPAWVITGNGITSHARLLVGMYGPDEEESRATYSETILEFVDPIPGDFRYETALSFFDEFEREAAFLVNSNQGWVDLRWQVITY